MTSLIRRNDKLSTLREDIFWPLEQHFNNFFNEFFKGSSLLDGVKASSGYPRMDVLVEDDYLTVKIAVPGLSRDNLKVEVLPDRILRISGQMSEEYHSSKDAKMYVQELRKGQFSRQLALPDWVEGDPQASLKDGILKLQWKVQEPAKEETKLIEVKAE